MPEENVLELEEMKKVQIFATGTHAGISFTTKELDEIAETYNKLVKSKKHDAPFKLGHDNDQEVAEVSGMPALGWATKVWREGNRLFAKFKEVPKIVKDAVKKGLYKKISVELYPPALAEQKLGIEKWVLRAVALLGADVPEVKGMIPVGALMADAEPQVIKCQLMVPANRHPYGALVERKGKEGTTFIVDRVLPDGTYGVHDMRDFNNIEDFVPHDDLTLLTEEPSVPVQRMDEGTDGRESGSESEENQNGGSMPENEPNAPTISQKDLDEKDAELKAEREQNVALLTEIREGKVSAFLEKYKEKIAPALHDKIKAVAMSESGVVKLGDKEEKFLPSFLALLGEIVDAKKLDLSETEDGGSQEEPEVNDEHKKRVEMAEQEVLAPHKGSRSVVTCGNAELHVLAEDRARRDKISYREAFLIEAKLQGKPETELPNIPGHHNPANLAK